MKITLHGARCAVTGYGRTAKVLADMLAALGARVTVAARKCSDLAWARTGGLDAVNISELMKTAPELDLLVNTVPSLVLDCKTLSALRRDCLVIDIASAPYGTDFACARELGLNVMVPGSLPGKTAPKTAGEIIADAILNIIRRGVDETVARGLCPVRVVLHAFKSDSRDAGAEIEGRGYSSDNV